MHSNFYQSNEKSQNKYQPLVLIIDDDKDNLLFASCVIESLGMRYVVTNDSEECINIVCQLLPDIILLDIVMPKLNGIEITRLIKSNQYISHIPIIAVTGLTRPDDRNSLLEAGCNDYLCKPYMIEELESKIFSHLKCLLVEM